MTMILAYLSGVTFVTDKLIMRTMDVFAQVDMKIMYYELIRMLIDYERKNHPETYDATKTVGKIEGYQELTNKLQR